jgi:hypothetical protein
MRFLPLSLACLLAVAGPGAAKQPDSRHVSFKVAWRLKPSSPSHDTKLVKLTGIRLFKDEYGHAAIALRADHPKGSAATITGTASFVDAAGREVFSQAGALAVFNQYAEEAEAVHTELSWTASKKIRKVKIVILELDAR